MTKGSKRGNHRGEQQKKSKKSPKVHFAVKSKQIGTVMKDKDDAACGKGQM